MMVIPTMYDVFISVYLVECIPEEPLNVALYLKKYIFEDAKQYLLFMNLHYNTNESKRDINRSISNVIWGGSLKRIKV